MQGGELGELNRQIVDSLRSINLLTQLWVAVNGSEPYVRLVLGATITEACMLVDLTYGQPASTPPRHRQLSLLEMLERDEPRSSAIPGLRAARDALRGDSLEHVRDLRNMFGAQIDDRVDLGTLLRTQETFDPAALNEVIESVGVALADAIRAERLLAPIKMHEASITGFDLAEPPPGARPYGDPPEGAEQPTTDTEHP